jgi:glycosyltransferase involved in cell wall biosynthesis
MPSETLVGIKAPIVALVHHPLALETGLSDRRRDELLKSERDALSRADAIIVSSPLTARTLVSDYGVAADRVTIAEPGTEPAIRSRGTGMPFTMLAVGALIPRKGYPILIDGLKELGREDWQLTIVGSPDHDPLESNRIRERVLSSGLRSRVKIAGKVSAKDLQRLFAHADLFVMPSLYEGYGMVLAEAMAHGLPIVCTTGGAAAETAPDEAAIKVSPGDAEAFSEAIARVMGDKALCDAMSEAAWEAGRRLPRWSTSVAKIAKVLKNVKKKENA